MRLSEKRINARRHSRTATTNKPNSQHLGINGSGFGRGLWVDGWVCGERKQLQLKESFWESGREWRRERSPLSLGLGFLALRFAATRSASCSPDRDCRLSIADSSSVTTTLRNGGTKSLTSIFRHANRHTLLRLCTCTYTSACG